MHKENESLKSLLLTYKTALDESKNARKEYPQDAYFSACVNLWAKVTGDIEGILKEEQA